MPKPKKASASSAGTISSSRLSLAIQLAASVWLLKLRDSSANSDKEERNER